MKYFAVLLSIVLLTSCRVTFTEKIRQTAESNGIDLSKIQFYNSEKITMSRTLASEDVKVASGKISIENGKYTEIIIIDKFTPGKCKRVDNGQLLVAFELGNNREFLFRNDDIRAVSGNYVMKPEDCRTVKKSVLELSANKSNKKNILPIQNVEKDVFECDVTYDGKKYKMDLAVMPYLLVKKTQVKKNQTKRRKAKGIIVD